MKTKSEVIAEIGGLLTAVGDKFEADEDAERDYLIERCPPHLGAAVRELPALAVHLMAAIADGSTNIVGLAARSGQLKGTVSKHVQRLVEAGLVERNPVVGNRKEIRLSLTDDGRRVDDVHRQMHAEMQAGWGEFLMHYSAAELAAVTKILSDLLRTEKRGVRLVGR